MHDVEDDIREIAAKLASIDKAVAILEFKLSWIDQRLKKDEIILQQVEQRKVSSFISKHWDKIPQLIVIIAGVIWFSNWVYDLPFNSSSSIHLKP